MKKIQGFNKGVNFGGWLSQCNYEKEHLDTFIQENDFKTAASWGIDHVRVPFDYNIIEKTDGTFSNEGFGYLDKAVEYSKKYSLNLILDLHKTAGFSFDYYSENESGFFDSPEYQERFYLLWEKVAKRYGSMTEMVAFELLNEVTDASFINKWNWIVKNCIRRIRKIAPDVLILVGSYHNNSADTVQFLDAPYDENVIYNMHCYEPLKFTHQGAYWTDAIIPEERMSFEDSEACEEYFENLFSTAIAKAEQFGSGLYCGEYGCIDVVSPEDTVKWYKTINSVFEKHGIGRAAWNYKAMDFGLSDDRLDSVRPELLKLL
ncbi:glycoside hydrolase family 5 protein [Ruminococcus flavefaciens]|uniref:glycoside hydrolase family 5 protein n=1 Tax=Ruminococcus flavefaciens TaxID=1265 RepID=UPI0026F211AA|nr:cellulase family glycosylhydrolase [Ruminococcus flavefaciens]MDD7517736.1 cellulase family glycosylhydrolase [Ruminococcus flavefaciens]MDY5690537.1 cellulase family glycosylhydrolase [Ruminococcus flavefaciens]